MNLKNTLLLSLLLFGIYSSSKAQISAPNIDFETGTTTGWTYYRGTNSPGPVWVLATCAPAPTLHSVTTIGGTDFYGGFPVVGNGMHSLKLGKDSSNMNADGASYNIHVPITGSYSITYRFAVVFEDPGHSSFDNPRFAVSFTDSATGAPLPCNTYVISAGSGLGFSTSTVSPFPIYRAWTTVNADLSTHSGKTIIASFKAGGCVSSGHWGYAYIDVDTAFLPGYGFSNTRVVPCHATTDTLVAPPGYTSYTWFDSLTFTHVYGTTQTCVITTPTITTTYAAIVQPYIGFGCTDTIYTRVVPPLRTSMAAAATVCAGSGFSLTSGATSAYPPMTYLWSPSTGLSCTTCDTVIVTPPSPGITSYIVTVSDASGCIVSDTISVTATPSPGAITGVTTIITGTTSTLSDAPGGGAWTSSASSVATIGALTGLVTGISPGTAVITYTIPPGCIATTIVTITPPALIQRSLTMKESKFLVFPNPSHGALTIQWQDQLTATAQVTITDVIGRKVSGTSLNINTASGEKQIDLVGLNNGIYFISVISENIHYSGKLLIQ